MTPQRITANGVDLCTESFGSPADPALLLIMGATASMIAWPDAFCEKLAAGGRFVIRYDSRDTGRSTVYPPGTPPYTLEDLADDAIGVLDAYGIDRAHVAGMSLGGMIAGPVGAGSALRDSIRIATRRFRPLPSSVALSATGRWSA